jgi:thiosulfate dehydrogenase
MRAALLLLFLAACGPIPAASYGEQLFNDPQFAGSQFNAWSCATCHASREGDTRLLPGASLVNSVNRPSYFGGKEPRLIDAVSFCYVYFMRGPGPLEPDEPRSRALYAYLDSLGDKAHAPALPMTIVLTTADVPRGAAVRGEEVYRSACETCHGAKTTGQGQNSKLASLLPNIAEQYPELFPGTPAGIVFIEKIRHGQFFEVGGNMPFFSKESLSDEDVGALLTYLGQ